MASSNARKLKLKRWGGSRLAGLIRLVARTSTIVTEPASLKADLRQTHPLILATWHGQFMMTCLMKPDDVPVAAMVARHGDAEVIGEAMAAFGVTLIRGAGAGDRRKDRGGAQALRSAVGVLAGRDGAEPMSLVMTADVPPGPARRAGEGIITIARLSGRPIVPVAAATSRYHALKTWSRVTINLPYSKLAFVGGAPIYVPRDADAATLEGLRLELQHSLNNATSSAYALAGADPARATPPRIGDAPVKPGLLLATYAVGMTALEPLAGRLLAYRLAQGKEDASRLNERRARMTRSRPVGPLAWVHAASVGETNAVLPVIEGLLHARPDLQVLLTTATVTSAAMATVRLPARAFHQFVPLDTPSYAQRFLDHWRPDLAIFTESEIWPSLILGLAQRRIPLALVNGRMSPRSYKRWRKRPSLSEPLFSRFRLVLTQNEKLARWYRDCGARDVRPVGNLKADAPPLPVDRVRLAELERALEGRPRLLAASTHAGEEAVILAAHQIIARTLHGFCTIIAPRHPGRGAEIAALVAAAGLRVALRSLSQPLAADIDVYIADTIGELGLFYSACPFVFVGNSLNEGGGHNPLEAVVLGAAVVAGPSTHDQRDEFAALQKAGGMIEVATAEELAAAVLRLANEPDAATRQVAAATAAAERLKGALPTTLAALLALLPADAQVASADTVGLAHAD